MLVIGLTGGIGAGKTTVTNLFAALDVPIVDADVIAKALTQKEQPAFAEIINHFGQDIILASGEINRASLRKIIFADAESRKWLENLLHPLVRKEIELNLNKISSPYCIVVIPLLVESPTSFSFLDRILVIDTAFDQQMQRAVKRDKLDEPEIKAIMAAQANRESRRKAADDIIYNDGDLEDLEKQVRALHQFYLDLSQHSK